MNPSRLLPSKRAAFTLVELLAVIAIIGVLAGIVIAVLGRVRESANRSTCASNLRQIVTSAMLYGADHGGNFLPPITNASGYQQWMFNRDYMELAGYKVTGTTTATLPEYFRCPTAQAAGSTLGINYGMNITGIGISSTNYKQAGYTPRLKLLSRPAQMIYLIDALDWWVQFSKANNYTGSEASGNQAPAYRHGGGANVAFFDGHVEYLKRDVAIADVRRWDVYAN